MGRATATLLAEAGANVVIADIDVEAGTRVAESIGATAVLEETDLRSLEAIESLQTFYQQIGRLPEFMNRLENECKRDPENRTAVQKLVELYAQEKRESDAARVLDASRAAMGDDPDLLYSIAHLYETIDQPQTTEEILAKVIQISPRHAAANNDLGYSWTDQGKNLDRAESMIRIAVDAEPDNESFLDSLGWVLYKRARFDEANNILYVHADLVALKGQRQPGLCEI